MKDHISLARTTLMGILENAPTRSTSIALYEVILNTGQGLVVTSTTTRVAMITNSTDYQL